MLLLIWWYRRTSRQADAQYKAAWRAYCALLGNKDREKRHQAFDLYWAAGLHAERMHRRLERALGRGLG